jgi:hypothetical protein
MKLWFYHKGIWLCAPPKCGGTSLYRSALDITCADQRATFFEAQQKVKFHSPDGVGRPAFMAVRDPIERFMSLWRDKCRNGDDNLPKLKWMNPDELLTVIENDWLGDPHWAPQSVHYRPGVTCVPFTDLLRWFAPVVGDRMPINYTTLHSDDPPAPTARILKHYWRDVELVYG